MAPDFAFEPVSSPNQTQDDDIQARRIARKRRAKERRRRRREEELEEVLNKLGEWRMLEESSPDIASKLREMKPRRFRMREEDLEEEERWMIEDKEKEILALLPRRRERMRLEDFASKQQHLILVHDSSQLWLGTAPRGPFKSVVCFSSFSSFVVGSVNGLICIAGRHHEGTPTPDDIWILNPFTQLSIKLPLPASPRKVDHSVSFAFSSCCDSEDSNYYKVFKVVCVSQPFPPHLAYDCNNLVRPVVSNHVEVWDSRFPHIWTEIKNVVFQSPFYHPGEMIQSCKFVVEKVAFWIVAGADGLGLFLLSVNMETHAVKQIPLPKLSIPVDFLIGKLIFRLENTFLFGAIWEGRFALLERLGFNTMLYNIWAIDDESGGASLIKKTTFLVDIGFHRFLSCINGKLLVEQLDTGLIVLFDMETRKGEVINVTNTFVDSAHDFVRTHESMQGFKPIQSFANCPEFTTFWPATSVSEDASGEKDPPVIEQPSVVVPPTSANVPSGVKPVTSVNVSPAAAKGSVPSAPKKTYASLVANCTRDNSPTAARVQAPPAHAGRGRARRGGAGTPV